MNPSTSSPPAETANGDTPTGTMRFRKSFFYHSKKYTAQCVSSDRETLNGGNKFPVKKYSGLEVTAFGNKSTTDVVFHIGDDDIHAHKAILASKSSVFKSEFADYERENFYANKYEIFTALDENGKHEILIEDMEPEVFKAVMHFIYESTIPRYSYSRFFFQKLLAAAAKYGLEMLGKKCESRLRRDISVGSVVDLLVVADRYRAEELKGACLEFVGKNRSEVVLSEEFKRMMEENHPSPVAKLLKKTAEEESGRGEECCFLASVRRFRPW